MNIRKIFSKCLKYSGTLRLLRNIADNKSLKILMYHRVFDKDNDFPYDLEGVPPSEFSDQMDLVSKYFSVVSLEEAVERMRSNKSLPKNAISVTVDDGYRDCYDHIYPVLRKYNMPASIFITTNHMDSSAIYWPDKVAYLFRKGRPVRNTYEHPVLNRIKIVSIEDREFAIKHSIQKLKLVDEAEKIAALSDLQKFFQVTDKELCVDYNLTWAQVKEMSNNGVSFGAHTASHPILTRVSIKMAEAEIIRSKERIESETNKRVYGFCYPNGTKVDFNDSIIAILKKHNFKYAVTTAWGFNNLKSDLFALKRVGPNTDDDLVEFECIISGGFEMVNWLRKGFGVKK